MTVSDSKRFMEMDLSGYEGEWIAMYKGEIVAHGKDFKEVAERAEKEIPRNRRPFIAKVPEDQVMLF